MAVAAPRAQVSAPASHGQHGVDGSVGTRQGYEIAMADPVSWLMIESGWDVVDRSGAAVGEVTRVVGDPDADIFDGLRFEAPRGGERYVAADRVGEIVEGRVSIEAELEELDEAPASGEPRGAELRRDRGEEL
jgi:hypothetical protein